MMRTLLSAIMLMLAALPAAIPAPAQNVGIRTNLLYLATTSPNIGVDWMIDRHFSLSLLAGYNPFRFKAYEDADGGTVNPKLAHWLLSAESRYWFCETMAGWNVGAHVIGGEYNLSPLRWMRSAVGSRYRGWAAGAGLTVGYQIPMAAHWGIDFSVGAGYVFTKYAKYPCFRCSDKSGEYQKHYIGPTKAAVSLIYYF